MADGTLNHADGMRLDLFAPGMTLLHKAGLAGLWMTLKGFEERGLQLSGGSWSLTKRSVDLHWDRDRGEFFKSLFQSSFKLTNDGLIWLAALGDPHDNMEQAVMLHSAMLGTFLQHGQTRKADPSGSPKGALTIEIDGRYIPLTYHRVSRYAHQKAAQDFGDGIERLPVAGWVVPGTVVRHVGLGGATSFEEPPERLLALLFAPAGIIYFQIYRRGAGLRPRFAMVVPEIDNLDAYADVRRAFLRFGAEGLQAGGTSEAGWRVLAELHARNLLGRLAMPQCRVFSFGTLPWSTQQKTRVEVFTVRAGGESALRDFRVCHQVFRVHRVTPKDRPWFWDVPQVPDLVARNLAEGRPWYVGFADYIADKERRRYIIGIKGKNGYEREGLSKMITEGTLSGTREEKFVVACHAAWRRRMGQLGERARRENASFQSLYGGEFERVRVTFSRCKNAAALREAITDFWARAGGSLPELQKTWPSILPLLDEKNWRLAKDLALLALASYSAPADEAAADPASPTL